MSINRLPSRIFVVISLLFIPATMGCSSKGEGIGLISGENRGIAATQRLSNVDSDTVRPVADRVFRTYFRVDPQTSSSDVWMSRPEEVRGEKQPVQLRDTLRASSSRHRRVAELRIIQKGTDVLAMCRVRNQRLETAERASFAEQRGDDRPKDTPIDRLGATSTYRQEDWVEVSRDRKTELTILEAIRGQLESPNQPTP